MSENALNLAVLISGGGTTLQNLIDEIAAGRLNARISVVIGSRPGLTGIDRAKAAGLPIAIVHRKAFITSADFSEAVFQQIDAFPVDLVCLAGWLCLLEIPTRFENKVMNIHPALLPSFGGEGMFGRNVHQAVLDHGCRVTGCTVHFVNNAYDSGPIILQRTCPVEENDTAETLAARVFEQEKQAYPEAIQLFQQNRLRVTGQRVVLLQPD